MSLRTRLSVNFGCTHTKAMDLNTLNDIVAETYVKALANGTLADQGDLVFHDRRTIAASGTDDIDLTALTDGFGSAVNVARVKALVIVNLSSTQVLTVGGAASNAWTGLLGSSTDTIKVRPGGILVVCAPDATALAVGGSSKVLRVANASGSAADYKLFVVGASA